MKNIRISDDLHQVYNQVYKDFFMDSCNKVKYTDKLVEYALKHINEIDSSIEYHDDSQAVVKEEKNRFNIQKDMVILEPPPEPDTFECLSVKKKPLILPWRGMKWRVHEQEGIGKLEAYCGFIVGAYDYDKQMIMCNNEYCISLWSVYKAKTQKDMMKEVEQRIKEMFLHDGVTVPDWMYKDFYEIDINAIRKLQEEYNNELEAICGKRIEY